MNFQLNLLITAAIILASVIPSFSKDLSIYQMKQKVDSLYDKGWQYLEINPDSSLYFGNHQKKLAMQINYDVGVVNAHCLIGQAYYKKSYFDQAAINFFNGLDILKDNSLPESKKKKLYLLKFLGVVYNNTYQYDTSLDYFFKALQIAKESNNKKSLEELYFNIGIDYWKKGEYDLASNYYKKSLKVSTEIGDSYIKARVYNSLGILYAEKNQHQLAKKNYMRALETGRKVKNIKSDVLMFKMNLGENYFRQNKYDSAKNIYLEALESSKSFNDIEKIKWIFNDLGNLYMKEGKFADAIVFYKKTIEIGDKEIVDEKLQLAYKNIALAYEAIGEYKLALENKSKYLAQSDKVLALKEDLSEQNAQYRMKKVEWQRKLMQAQLKAAQDRILYLSIISALSLIILSFIAWRLFRHYRLYKNARAILGEPIAVED